jgi:hypothetical protein
MGSLLQVLILILMLTGVMGFFCKIYFQIISKDPSKKRKYYHVVFRLVYITDFLPLRIKYKQGEELALRKKANKALAVFYINLILTAVLIAFL